MPDPSTLSPAAPFSIRLFGPMDVRVHGELIPPLRTRKGLWLLALLALRRGRDVPRDWIAETLWPDGTSAQALSSLRRTLTDLRRALRTEARRLSSPNIHALRLNIEAAFLDVAEFDSLVLKGDEPSLERALALYTGPLLEGCPEEWAVQEREQREQATIASLETLAQLASERGDHTRAVAHLRRAVALDPFRESAQRALMHSLAADGNYAAVVLAFRDYRELLRREMNADPDAETVSLFREIKDEAVRASARRTRGSSVLKDAPESMGILPVPLTSFVGREVELDELRALIATSPLVSLVGTGGVGKTRLAIRIAELASDDFPHGIWFVDLAVLRDAGLAESTVLRTFGLREATGRSPTESLLEHLKERNALLILDNCEHLIDVCARLANRVVKACPGVRVLATSRQPLRAVGETIWRAPSLSVPQPRDLPQKDEGLALVLPRSESVRLFIERATSAMPSFELTERNATAVLRIVRRLDGIPLAIELAAARVRMLSAEQVAARLDDRFRLLSRGSPAAPTRQQTLRSTIDWSHDLLSTRERDLLRRLAVFAGGWTFEAAEAVCTGPELTGTETIADSTTHLSGFDLLDALSDLADRSLVIADQEEGGERRYRMLETIREYAADKLRVSGDENDARDRHLLFYLSVGEEREYGSAEEATPPWLERMEIEHDNLRAALQHAAPGDLLLRLCLACYWFWNIRGYWREGRDWLEKALSHSVEDAHLRARALNSAGTLAWRQGDYPVARSLFEEGIRLCRTIGDQAQLASCLGNLGLVCGEEGKYAEARACHEEALGTDRANNNLPSIAKRLTNLGLIAMYEADNQAARGFFNEAVGLYRSLGIRRGLAMTLMNMGLIELREGDYDAAERCGLESMSICREISLRGALGHALLGLGMVAVMRKRYADAAGYYRECLEARRDIGDSKGTADSLTNISDLLRERGRPVEAVRLWAAAERIMHDIGSAVSPSEKPEYDRTFAAMRSSVSPAVFEAAWQSGSALTTNTAIAEALALLDEV